MGKIGVEEFSERNKPFGMQYPVLARVRIVWEFLGGSIDTSWVGRRGGAVLGIVGSEDDGVGSAAGVGGADPEGGRIGPLDGEASAELDGG